MLPTCHFASVSSSDCKNPDLNAYVLASSTRRTIRCQHQVDTLWPKTEGDEAALLRASRTC